MTVAGFGGASMRLDEVAPSSRGLAGHLVAVSAGIATYAAASAIDPLVLSAEGASTGLHLAALAAALLVMVATDTAIAPRDSRSGMHPASVARSLVPLHLSLASAAALFLLARPVIGLAAYPLLLAPLAATHHALRQLGSVRRTFHQMVDALSTVPELAGYSHRGHAERVAALATETAHALRLDARLVRDVELAARLHDLGRLRAASPEHVSTIDAASLAASGASIVRMTGSLPGVADLIERHHEPYVDRRGRTTGIPIGAQIVGIASQFDDLTATGSGALDDESALALLERSRERRFDGRVVDAFATTVRARRPAGTSW